MRALRSRQFGRSYEMASFFRKFFAAKHVPHGEQPGGLSHSQGHDYGPWEKIETGNLAAEGARSHIKFQDRYISLIRHKGQLVAIDSLCYHAGGPVGMGDIEDLTLANGECRACIVCPWHDFKISLSSGEKYHQALRRVDGKLVPGDWTTTGKKQRVHLVDERPDGIWVSLHTAGDIAADEYAHQDKFGSKLLKNCATSTYQGRVSRACSGSGSMDLDGAAQSSHGANSPSKSSSRSLRGEHLQNLAPGKEVYNALSHLPSHS